MITMNMKVNFSKVKLLIFDLDGTLFNSSEANYVSINNALTKLGLRKITREQVETLLGKPSPEFYQLILPKDKAGIWKSVQKEVRDQYDFIIKEYGKLFPGVKSTLAELKKRNYTLVLYSFSGVAYFDTTISSLGIGEYFDHAECTEQNGLTKIELVAKIRKKFGNPGTAVIGDRLNDYEAARSNNSLSVGILYGYGKDEPYQADITIKRFPEMLDIFKSA